MYLRKPLHLLCLLWISLALAHAQQTAPVKPKTSLTATLAKPRTWGVLTIRLFKNTPRETIFSMDTSWIPGQEHKGMFRYRVTAIADQRSAIEQLKASEEDTPETTEKFLERVHACNFTMVLYDADGFLLRRVPVVFQRGMNANAQVSDLNTNTSEQMDQEEYVSLVGSNGGSGRWDISWSGCE